MELVTFDTLAAAKTLERAGFDDTQAEAMVKTINKAVNESVATKADLKVLDESVKGEFKAVYGEFKAVRGEFKTIRGEIKALELRMTIKFGAMHFATALFILGVGKFLF